MTLANHWNGIGGTIFILPGEEAAGAQGWSIGADWEIASGKALRGKIGSIGISQVAIPQGPNIVSSSTNYDPEESGLAA